MSMIHLTKQELEAIVIDCIQVVVKKRLEALSAKVDALTDAINRSNGITLPPHLLPENEWSEFVGMSDAIKILQWKYSRGAILKLVEGGKIVRCDDWAKPMYKTADLFEIKRKRGL